MNKEDQLVEKLIVRGVAVYRFKDNTRYAVDQYLDLVDADVTAHIEAGHVDTPMCYVIDVSQSGMYSINYMRGKAEIYVSRHDKFPENYIAYVTDDLNDSILVNMLNAMAQRGLSNTRKLFKSDVLDEAIDWLLTIA